MQSRIDNMLDLDKTHAKQAEQLCQQLIYENAHDFFHALLYRIFGIAQALTQIDMKEGKEDVDNIKRLLFILNRELTVILKTLSSKDKDKAEEIWAIFSSLLAHPNLNLPLFKIILPSLSHFISLCNQMEIRSLFLNIDQNQNEDAEIVLLIALFQSKTKVKTICAITKPIFLQFQKDFILTLQEIQYQLENQVDMTTAINLVCKTVKNWSEYLEIFIQLLQMCKNHPEIFDEISAVLNSKTFLLIIQKGLSIDLLLLLKEDSETKDQEIDMDGPSPKFKVLLKSNYKKLDIPINSLKALILDILNMTIKLNLKSKGKISKDGMLGKLITDQVLHPIMSDLFLLGTIIPKKNSSDALTLKFIKIINSVASFLSTLSEIEFFKVQIVECLKTISTEMDFIFFACLCNIERFEQKSYIDRETLHEEDDQGFKITRQTNNKFMSDFSYSFIPITSLQVQQILYFGAEAITFLLDEDPTIQKVFSERLISQEILCRVQQQTVNHYFHFIQSLSKDPQLFSQENLKHPSFLKFIDIAAHNFKNLFISLQAQFLSICLRFSHLWVLQEFRNSINRLIGGCGILFGQSAQQCAVGLDFLYSAIVRLIKEDLQKQSQKKNYHTIMKFFQYLMKMFKSVHLNEENYICKILSKLVLNEFWMAEMSSFHMNFIIYESCLEKIENLQILLQNQNLNDDETKKLLPCQLHLILFGNCVLALQLQFDSEDEKMCLKMSSMRETIIRAINLISFFTHLMSQNEVAQICRIMQFLSGTHLGEKVCKDLVTLLKNDEILVQTISSFLKTVNPISRSFPECLCNLIISFQGNIQQKLLKDSCRKILQRLTNSQATKVCNFLLKEILNLVNTVFLYEINDLIEDSCFQQICRQIFIITGENEKNSRFSEQRKSRNFNRMNSEFKEIQIELFLMKCFILSTKCKNSKSDQHNSFGMKNKRFSSFVSDFKRLRVNMSLEKFTLILFALENPIKFANDDWIEKEFTFELGFKLVSFTKKDLKIDLHLKQRFNPIKKMRCMLEEMREKMKDSLKSHDFEIIAEICCELDKLKLEFPTQKAKKFIKERTLTNIWSEQSSESFYQDIVI